MGVEKAHVIPAFINSNPVYDAEVFFEKPETLSQEESADPGAKDNYHLIFMGH
jgi:hypothetical protein